MKSLLPGIVKNHGVYLALLIWIAGSGGLSPTHADRP
jgi:hypothetical protein